MSTFPWLNEMNVNPELTFGCHFKYLTFQIPDNDGNVYTKRYSQCSAHDSHWNHTKQIIAINNSHESFIAYLCGTNCVTHKVTLSATNDFELFTVPFYIVWILRLTNSDAIRWLFQRKWFKILLHFSDQPNFPLEILCSFRNFGFSAKRDHSCPRLISFGRIFICNYLCDLLLLRKKQTQSHNYCSCGIYINHKTLIILHFD